MNLAHIDFVPTLPYAGIFIGLGLMVAAIAPDHYLQRLRDAYAPVRRWLSTEEEEWV